MKMNHYNRGQPVFSVEGQSAVHRPVVQLCDLAAVGKASVGGMLENQPVRGPTKLHVNSQVVGRVMHRLWVAGPHTSRVL